MKKNKRFLVILLALAFPFACVGCSQNESVTYDKISGAEAKALMDSEKGYVIIDARTQEEYDEGHIAGAILIPEYEIAAGADGVGIANIEKTSSDGNVDTYTITLTNGTTYTFTVTNGTNGTDGKDGVDGKDGTNGTNGVGGKDGTDGEDGQTPYIGENGNWWIGDTDTGVKAAGDDGKDGAVIAATAVGGTALISNIALIAWVLIKKKILF